MKLEDLHIETKRLIIRPYTVDDASAIKEAVDTSLKELSEFMPWAKLEPKPISSKIEKIKKWEKLILNDRNYTIGMFLKDGQFIGSTGFHVRHNAILEIGYWAATKLTGKGYVTEASKALTSFAFDKLNADSVQIVTDESNVKSEGIPKRLGFNLEYSCRCGERNKDGNRSIENHWIIFKEEWNV